MNGFGADTGQASPEVLEALRAACAGAGDVAEIQLLGALADTRLLLPVVAAPPAVAQAWAAEAHDHDHHDGHEHDDGQDHDDGHEHDHATAAGTPEPAAMAAVRLVAPDGRQGLPVFTGLDVLTSWDDAARPLPMTAADTARMAIEEGCDVLIVDLGAAHAYVLRTSMVWALAEERPWLPAARDPLVIAAVEAGSHGIDGVLGAGVATPGSDDEPGTLVVDLFLEPGLHAERVQAAAAALGERLAADPLVRCRLDGVRFALRPA